MHTYLHRLGRAFALLTMTFVLVACARTDVILPVDRPDSSAVRTDPPGQIEFEGRNVFRKVRHRFELWRFVRVDLNDGAEAAGGLGGEIEVEIDVASVETGSAWLNRRARSAKFLDVGRYPTARLWIGNVRPVAEEAGGESPWVRVGRHYRADMELELRGVRERGEIKFDVVSTSPLMVAGEVVLSRKAFGIGPPYRRWNPFSIEDEVQVRFEARIPVGE